MDTEQIKKNQYLDKINHAPYGAIVISGLIGLVVLTAFLLLGIF